MVNMSLVKPVAGQTIDHNLSLVLVLYLCVALVYGLVTPIYEGPDEIGHVLYVKHIAEGRGIPVQSPEYARAYGFGQEGSQAPLYYALNAALVRVFGLSLDDLEGLPAINPFSTCGRPRGRDNVAFYRHDPRQEVFPYRGAARAVHVMRLFSALLGVVTVAAVYVATRLAFPGLQEAPLLAAALVAFNPQFAFMGGVVNNDNLVNCLMAVAVAFTLYCLRRGFTWRRALVLGILCGLAPLAKLGGLMALAFAGIALLVGLWRRPGRLVVLGAVVGVAFLAVAGWWFVRNWMLYGDPTGVNMMLSIYGGRGGWPAHLIIPEIFDTFRSYWAAFACGLTFPIPVHWLFGLLVGAGVVSLVVGLVRKGGKGTRGQGDTGTRGQGDTGTRGQGDRGTGNAEGAVVWLLFVWLVLVVAAWARWNQITFAALGRLLFQANVAIGALLGYGLARLTSRPRWVLVGVEAGLFLLALSGAVLVVRPAFALPVRYPVAAYPAPPEQLPPATFAPNATATASDDLIEVVGYEVAPRSLEPGDTLQVRLFLQAARPITGDYALAIQLLSPVPGDETTLINYNTIPGSGNYPTYVWQPDEVIDDPYVLQIPEQVDRAQAWRVVVIFCRLSDGERLSVRVADHSTDEMLDLGMVRVGASEPAEGCHQNGPLEGEVPPDARLDSAPVFGQAAALRGAQVSSAGETLRVALWWEALAPLAADYTVFVHLIDEDGQLAGTGDGPPLGGAFPTSVWNPGDWILDEHNVPLPPDLPSGVYTVQVGWYDPTTGARLPAVQAEERLAQDAVVVGTWPKH